MNQKMGDWYNRFCANRRVVKVLDDSTKAEELAYVAANLSYRASVLRALKFYGKNAEALQARKEGEKVIYNFLVDCYTSKTAADIDYVSQVWEKIYQIYKGQDIQDYTYGNAQKWVNMSIKYYIILLWKFNLPYEELLEIPVFPVDRIMINHIKKHLEITFDGNWSDCDDKDALINYICSVKAKVNQSLFVYELDAWN